jgi:hypothetical protein
MMKHENLPPRARPNPRGSPAWLSPSAPRQNNLATNLSAEKFSLEEDERLVRMVKHFGTKWATIKGHMPGRSENGLKNR